MTSESTKFDFTLSSYLDWVKLNDGKSGQFGYEYLKGHHERFLKTIELISQCKGESVLEVGATDFFLTYMKHTLGFQDVWGTVFTNNIEEKLRRSTINAAGVRTDAQLVSVNLEHEFFPIGEERFDLVLLCEVIEHMDIDPMFCLIELNRIMKNGAHILITTPNSCSSRNTYKACLGYRPHFYMQYHRDRSPYRHNFEHDVHSLRSLVEAAGFHIEKLETHDVFEPTNEKAINFLVKNGLPTEHRGDDIFVLARKVGLPVDRWPEGVYV